MTKLYLTALATLPMIFLSNCQSQTDATMPNQDAETPRKTGVTWEGEVEIGVRSHRPVSIEGVKDPIYLPK